MDINKISQSQLDKLLRAEAKLNALEAGGVDNWEGYDFALEDYRKEERESELIDDCVDAILSAASEHADVEEPAERGAGYAVQLDGATQDIKSALRDLLKEMRNA